MHPFSHTYIFGPLIYMWRFAHMRPSLPCDTYLIRNAPRHVCMGRQTPRPLGDHQQGNTADGSRRHRHTQCMGVITSGARARRRRRRRALSQIHSRGHLGSVGNMGGAVTRRLWAAHGQYRRPVAPAAARRQSHHVWAAPPCGARGHGPAPLPSVVGATARTKNPTDSGTAPPQPRPGPGRDSPPSLAGLISCLSFFSKVVFHFCLKCGNILPWFR